MPRGSALHRATLASSPAGSSSAPHFHYPAWRLTSATMLENSACTTGVGFSARPRRSPGCLVEPACLPALLPCPHTRLDSSNTSICLCRDVDAGCSCRFSGAGKRRSDSCGSKFVATHGLSYNLIDREVFAACPTGFPRNQRSGFTSVPACSNPSYTDFWSVHSVWTSVNATLFSFLFDTGFFPATQLLQSQVGRFLGSVP